ncbi:two-component regulator propeller domain-containing protein [Rhodanobacter ginsenosidimutans]|uniref:histidine kinase n=1 Tax=Rhodanobacter ginsenosidimutans TaxID=490571 RepID=A0ABW0JZT2_9GAMM
MLAMFLRHAVRAAALLVLAANMAYAASASATTAPVAGASIAGPLPTPQFRRYGVADGLPSGPVYSVAQDRNGFMWFGSSAGLVRFDGVSFKTFRHSDADPGSLPANTTYALFVDCENRIWAGGISTGLISYDQRSGRFRHWEHDDAKPDSLSGNEVWSIAETSDGTLWVATDHGLDRLRADGNGFDHLALDAAGEHATAFGETRALLADADGRLWIGARRGLFLRHGDGTISRVPIDRSFEGDVGMAWHIEGGHGEVRVSMTGGLLIIGSDGVARPVANKALAARRIPSSTRDAQGRLWIGTMDGLLLNTGEGKLQAIASQPLLPGGLPGSKIWQTALDHEGGLWITFEQSSVAYLPPDWNGFARFTHVPDDPTSLSNIAASAILLARDGQLWVGGENGWVDKLDATTGKVQHVVRGVRGQIVWLAEDLRGRLWIASPGELHLFDHGKLSPIDIHKAGIMRPVMLCAATDGRIYVAAWGGGVFAIDADSRAISKIPMEDPTEDSVAVDQIGCYADGPWYASADGLRRWDPASRQMVLVDGVPRHEILTFARDAGGFWLVTRHSLDHYRYADGKARRDDSVDISAQPFASVLTDLRIDRSGNLWMFANPGLWRMGKDSRQLRSFGPAQGLSNVEFNSGAVAVAANGMMFAANSGGVVAFQPALFPAAVPAGSPPQVTLASLNVQRDGAIHALPRDGSVVPLHWRDRDLRVEVRVASYVNPEANRYRFKLTGFDTNWVDVDHRGERDFAGLPAGDYKLEVMAAGPGGVWGHLATPLRIHVQAPPWARWWAWAIYAAVLALVGGLALRGWRNRMAQRYRLQLIEQQRELAEQASAAKTQFLATLSHEIRTPMTGVMGMAELLLSTPLNAQQHDYAQAMQRSGGMLLKLLNDALDLARIEAGRLELELAPFDPRQLVTDVAQLEQGLAQAKGLRFVLQVDDDLPERVVGDAVRVKQILLNLANNALKFTQRGSVTVRAQRSADGLLFSISDTGPGIPEASQARLFERFEQEAGPQRRAGSGLGLAICRELADMMGGSIELESRVAHGSIFRVRLPLPEPPPLAPSTVASHRSGQARRILMVEDDAIVAAVLRGLLEQQGHDVCHVANGLAALAELPHAQFDVVLLDLDLPGVDGFQIARLIRQREPAGQRVPIVAVTARSGSGDEALARAAGMDGFLRKPVSGEQLADALANFAKVDVEIEPG